MPPNTSRISAVPALPRAACPDGWRGYGAYPVFYEDPAGAEVVHPYQARPDLGWARP